LKPTLAQAMTRQGSPARNLQEHGESVSDRLVRFPGASWDEIEALPQPLRWTVQRTIFHTVTVHQGQEVISVQHVSLDT
jgi:hypothetical protein